MVDVILQGLGHIGKDTARLLLDDPRFCIVGAIDIAPHIQGKDLGEVLGCARMGVSVTDDRDTVYSSAPQGSSVLLTTRSRFVDILPDVEAAVKKGFDVVSPSEELFYPQLRSDHALITELDALATQHGARILGRGVNPGCLMDAYPVARLKQAGFDYFTTISISRHDDTRARRAPLLQKTGTGLTSEQFKALCDQGKLGHVGLQESAHYVAERMGIVIDKMEFTRLGVYDSDKDTPVPLNGTAIAEGSSRGISERCHAEGLMGDHPIQLVLDLNMSVGTPCYNGVRAEGMKDGKQERFECDYNDIVNGDIATARVLKDCLLHVKEGDPGLNRTSYVTDVPRLLAK